MCNIDELISRIKETVDSHRLEREGNYCRWLWQNEAQDRKCGLNEYGCADAANILYTLNDFVTEPQKRKAWVDVLRSFQNPETGVFSEPTHHFLHTTAHCVAALELFDAQPLYPLKGLMQYASREGLYGLLDNLKWTESPWSEAHKGAGIYAAMKLTDTVDLSWERAYFDWLWENQDPETGMWKTGSVLEGNAPLFHHMGGSFHYFFNIEYAKRKVRYPEKMIDTCLALYHDKKIGDKTSDYDNEKFGKSIGFLEIDWVYTISRASRQTTYRYEDCKNTVREFATQYIDWLYSLDYKAHDGFNDLHMLFGTSCALAELQQYLCGEIETAKPLRLVLDRRPFI